jgi:hypothetical protein
VYNNAELRLLEGDKQVLGCGNIYYGNFSQTKILVGGIE